MSLKYFYVFCFVFFYAQITIAQKNDSISNKFTISKLSRPKKTHSFKIGENVKVRVESIHDSLDIVGSDIVYTGTILNVGKGSISLSLSEESKIITYKDFTEKYVTNVYKNDPILFPLQKAPIKEIAYKDLSEIGKERNLNKAASIIGIYAFIGGLVTAPIFATNFNTGKINGRAYYTWLSGAMAISAISFGVSYTFGVKKYHLSDSPEISNRRKWKVKMQ